MFKYWLPILFGILAVVSGAFGIYYAQLTSYYNLLSWYSEMPLRATYDFMALNYRNYSIIAASGVGVFGSLIIAALAWVWNND